MRWSRFNLSGPKAEEFEDFLMALMTRAGVKGEKLGFKLWILRNLRIIFLEERLDLWGVVEVNCLTKEFAIFLGEVWTF